MFRSFALTQQTKSVRLYGTLAVALAAIFCSFVLIAHPVAAATCNFSSTSTGNSFNNGGNWSCGHTPTAGDSAFVPSATSVTLNANVSFDNLSTTGTVVAGAFNLTVTSALTVYVGGSVSSTSGVLTFTGAASSSGSVSSTSGNMAFGSTFQNWGQFVIGSGTATTTGTLTNGSTGSILNQTGVLSLEADYVNGGTYTAGSSTLRVAGTADQAIAGDLYKNLISIKTLGTATFAASSTILGTLNAFGSGGTISGGSTGLSVVATTTILLGANVSSTSGTLTFNGVVTSTGRIGSVSGDQIYVTTFVNNGTFGVGSGTATTTAAFTNGTGGTINGNTGMLSVSSTWTNSGTFTAGTGIVRFISQTAQTIPATTYYNLYVYTTGGSATFGGNATAGGVTRVVSGSTLAVDTTTFTATGLITNTGTMTLGVGGKIVHTAESFAFTDTDGGAITTYAQGSHAFITLQDSNRNLLGDTVETMLVTISIGSTDSETVTLTETGAATGIFRNTTGPLLVSWGTPTSANGKLEAAVSGTMTSSYTDNQDAADTADASGAFTVTTAATSGTASTGGGGGGGGGAITLFNYTNLPAPAPASTVSSLPLTFTANSLVKLANDGNAATQQDSAVYYYGKDGRRHAFPNDKAFFTWYNDFSQVQIISAAEMSRMPLGQNVTYRPGVRMVKFATLNNVYAVDAGGLLHWVKTEAVANALYGATWNKQIDDINDAFYANYRFGTDISTASDYVPTAVTTAASSIQKDMGF